MSNSDVSSLHLGGVGANSTGRSGHLDPGVLLTWCRWSSFLMKCGGYRSSTAGAIQAGCGGGLRSRTTLLTHMYMHTHAQINEHKHTSTQSCFSSTLCYYIKLFLVAFQSPLSLCLLVYSPLFLIFACQVWQISVQVIPDYVTRGI